MNNKPFNSQHQTPHEEAKIMRLGSSQNHYIRKELNSSLFSKDGTSKVQSMDHIKEMNKK